MSNVMLAHTEISVSENKDAKIVHLTVCMSTAQLSLLLTVPIPGGMARLS